MLYGNLSRVGRLLLCLKHKKLFFFFVFFFLQFSKRKTMYLSAYVKSKCNNIHTVRKRCEEKERVEDNGKTIVFRAEYIIF